MLAAERGYDVHAVVDGISSQRPSDRAVGLHVRPGLAAGVSHDLLRCCSILQICESSPSVNKSPELSHIMSELHGIQPSFQNPCTAQLIHPTLPPLHRTSDDVVGMLCAQRIASSGAFLVTSEMALFQLCGDAKVGRPLLRRLTLLCFEPPYASVCSHPCTSVRLNGGSVTRCC